MKLDIENKILIPFIILIIISIFAVGLVSYNGSYHLLLESKLAELQEDLEEISRIIERSDFNLTSDQLVTNIKKLKKNNLIIIDGSGNTVFSDYGSDLNRYLLEEFKKTKERNDYYQFRLDNRDDKILFLFKKISPQSWYIGTGMVLNSVSFSLLEIQKYTIFVAIIFAIIAVELTIAIAHNLSKPIKKLAEACNKISTGDFNKKLDFKRTDEIGVLAEAFNNMISKIERSTEELKNLKEMNEDILRSTTTGIVTVDNCGNVSSINRAAEKILGKGEQLNEEIYSKIIELSLKALKKGRGISDLYKFNSDTETGKVIEINTSLLTSEKGIVTGALCSFNDITKRKEIEEKMEQIDKLKSLGQLAAGLAHEIRNPLAGMKTSAQVLMSRLKNNRSAVMLLDKIVSEIDRVNELVSDILNFAKPQEPCLEVTEVTSLIREAVELMGEHIKSSDVIVKDELPGEKYYSKIDKGQFKQILVNLVMNSLKAMENGGELLLKGGKQEQEPYFTLVIADTGKGISPEIIDRIFDPFFTTYAEGTGLGLSVVKRLVIQNNGDIRVASRPGEGTRFTIKLPLIEEDSSK
ncbi:MAG: two-component system, NtrC family, sensor histidine kinase AtoS [Clostridia bacterium]|nr:two-component system, NtrC family, sensor histidine kinase AtoS [Clostridia bacterium]